MVQEKTRSLSRERGQGVPELKNSGDVFCSIRDAFKLWTGRLRKKRKRRRLRSPQYHRPRPNLFLGRRLHSAPLSFSGVPDGKSNARTLSFSQSGVTRLSPAGGRYGK